MIDRFCDRGIDAYLYVTPRHMWEKNCDPSASLALYTLEFLRRMPAACQAHLHYFDFAYPNAVTLEGVSAPVSRSFYYRPDGHPRPTVGVLMAASMFGSAFPPSATQAVRRDFGADLMTAPRPKEWLRERAGRCVGIWKDARAPRGRSELSGAAATRSRPPRPVEPVRSPSR